MSAVASPARLLATASRAARRAADHARRHQASRRGETLRIDRHDVKLVLDVECQRIAAETILEAFPEHTVWGEEGPLAAPGRWNWVIDPIDGTVNYAHGLTQWCCAVAARDGERVLAGAVAAPAVNRLYEAAIDGPACCNGCALRVSAVADPSRAVVFTGADKEEGPDDRPFRFFDRIAANVQRPRISGSAALDLCEVARGGADAYFEPGVYLWDVAAAGLIVRRAGGRAETFWHRPGCRLACLAANPRLFGAMRVLLEPLLPADGCAAIAAANPVPAAAEPSTPSGSGSTTPANRHRETST